MSTQMEIEPAYRKALCAAGLVDFDAFLTASGAAPTSKHKARETLPIQIEIDGQEKCFFLKRVFKVPLKHALVPLFLFRKGRSQPAIEWQRCKELADAGIGVMKPVAYGERRRMGLPTQAFLLVEAVPIPHTLENWLVPGFPRPAPLEKRLRDRLLFELGDLVRKIGDAGFIWPDISPKHIYAEPMGGENNFDRWTFYLIDVERMEKVSSNSKITNLTTKIFRHEHLLSLLRRHLSPLSLSRYDFLRLWARSGVKAKSAFEVGNNHESHGRIDAKQAILRYRDESGPRLPDDYEHPRCVPLRKLGKLFVDQRIVPWLERAGIRSFDDVFRYESGDALNKPGLPPHRDRIRMVLSNECGQSRTFYLKRYRKPPWVEQLRRIRECGLKSSSGWREIHFIKRLSLLGIPTLRGVAFGQKMKGLFEKRSFAITEEVTGQSLEKIADRAGDDPAAIPSWRDRREIIRQLALITARLHNNHLFHRDLYLCHVFLCPNADGGIVLRLIDLARMIEKKGPGERWRVKDLAALDYSAPAPLVTRADRLRFLYDYLSVKLLDLGSPERDGRGTHRLSAARTAARRMIKAICAKTRRMARHDSRRAKRREL